MEEKLLQYASEEIFTAVAIIDTTEIVFNPIFRTYCEENACGKYGSNYSCPPDCGDPEEMKRHLLQYPRALVVQTKWDISDYTDKEAIRHAKTEHNHALLRVVRKHRAGGGRGLMCGASNCCLCSTCAITDGAPCKFPDLKFSCLSAYCVHVKKLADLANMDYAPDDGLLAFFGMYAFAD